MSLSQHFLRRPQIRPCQRSLLPLHCLQPPLENYFQVQMRIGPYFQHTLPILSFQNFQCFQYQYSHLCLLQEFQLEHLKYRSRRHNQGGED